MVGLSSLASKVGVGGLSERTTNATLYEIGDDNLLTEETNADFDAVGPLAFQYFPESLTDTKQINIARKEIPGGSLPLYQWVNSGERQISFQAVFTTDVNTYDESGTRQNQNLLERLKAVAVDRRNVDIVAAIAWLRRCLLPSYLLSGAGVGIPIARAPRTLLLHLLGSGIGLAGGGSSLVSQHSVLCLMTQCDVTYEAFFPNGVPRIASVSLAFVETPQWGGRVTFQRRDTSMIDAIERYTVKGDTIGGRNG